MGVVVVGLAILNILVLGLFQFVKPEHSSTNAMMVFNICAYCVGFAVAGASLAYTMSWEVTAAEEELRQALALTFALSWFGGVMFVMFLLRNFFLFRSQRVRRGGSPF